MSKLVNFTRIILFSGTVILHIHKLDREGRESVINGTVEWNN